MKAVTAQKMMPSEKPVENRQANPKRDNRLGKKATMAATSASAKVTGKAVKTEKKAMTKTMKW